MRCIHDDDVSLLEHIKQGHPDILTGNYSYGWYCNYLWIHRSSRTSWGWCTDQKELSYFSSHFRSTYIYEGYNTDSIQVVGLWDLLQYVKEVAPKLYTYRMLAVSQ